MTTSSGVLSTDTFLSCWRFRVVGTALLVVAWSFLLAGCVSAPHEVVRLHEKQTILMQDLQRTHLAMIDAYIDQRLKNFEAFYFAEYGPVFRKNWEASFRSVTGRQYDPETDFRLFYNDLVAEYQVNVEPITKMRRDLRDAVSTAYAQTSQAHDAIGGWIRSVEGLNQSQRETANKLLGAIAPSLSLDQIDQAIEQLKGDINKKIAE